MLIHFHTQERYAVSLTVYWGKLRSFSCDPFGDNMFTLAADALSALQRCNCAYIQG